MTPQFRALERVVAVSCPCNDCGKESDAYAEFSDGTFQCKDCCDRDDAVVVLVPFSLN